jgi:hypothetical protein
MHRSSRRDFVAPHDDTYTLQAHFSKLETETALLRLLDDVRQS